jgi:transposase-like protein
MLDMPKQISDGVKERAVRLVLDHQQEYPTLTAAIIAVAKKEGVARESVRRWVMQAQVDGGQRDGLSSSERLEIKELKAKVKRLEEDNAILKAATIFFAGELDPHNR